MPDLPLHDVDARMLRVLCVLLTECNVSRAAGLLDISQPTASQSLRRWRDLVGDPLLVRSGSRMMRTDRGTEILNRVTLILGELNDIIRPQQEFDALHSRRKISIFAANALGPYFVPRLVELLQKEAPRMALDFHPMVSESQLMDDLNTGNVDVALGNWPTPPANMHYARLFQSTIVCLVRPEHPLSQQTGLTLQEYLQQSHLSPTPSSSISISPISARLAEIGVRRHAAISITEFSLVPHVLARSDLVFTTAAAFANDMAQQHGFHLLQAPPELGSMTFYMLWQERMHKSAYGQWLRSIIKRIFAEMHPHHL